MSLFEKLGQNVASQQSVQSTGRANNTQVFFQEVNALRTNPVQYLKKAGYNIPDTLSNDPQGIIQHLMNTNQVNRQNYNQAQNRFSQLQQMFRGRRR